MNKIIIILFCAALTLAACGGAATQNAGTDSASTNDGGSEQTTAPQDTIAKTIWEKLKTDDPHISRVVECGNEFEYNYYKDEQEKYFSKTSMDYKYHVPRGSEEPDNFINALYRLQCYPMSDGGWLAIVEQSVNGYALKKEDCGYKIFVVKYNDGNLSYPKNADYFPECFSFVEGKLGTEFERDRSHIQYSDKEMYYRTTSCWPLKFVWNGKKFETPSKFIFNAVSMYNGSFSSRYSHYASIGQKWEGSPDGIFREESDSGKALAKLELQDQIIVGYTILDSLSGVVQDFNSDSITHSPIALGYPIKNVLEYKDNPKAWSHHMKDSTISKGMKDGKYVITQHLEHDTRDARRDIFIDFVAKDENSPIEAIKVYSSPFQVTIQDQVEKQKDISDEAKEIFPIVAHEYLGAELKGKDVVILDDMISSGDSMLEVGRELKKRGAGRIFFCATFGLFTEGLARFDKAYEEGIFDKVVTTNLIYQAPELLQREYYINADMSKYIALIIDTLNHDFSISEFLDPTDRIHKIIEKHNKNR